jgi:hypothetical protein
LFLGLANNGFNPENQDFWDEMGCFWDEMENGEWRTVAPQFSILHSLFRWMIGLAESRK